MSLVKKIVLDASRAQVWDAVATGPGLSSWFVPHELEPRRGGTGRAEFGGLTFVEGRVLAYEPGHRIVLGAERIAHDVGAEPEPESDTGLEFWIGTSEDDPDGSRTTLYFRQRGFPEADQAAYEAGWDVYFHTLTEYFKYFAPMPSATTTGLVLPPMGRSDAFQRMLQSFGVTNGIEVGQELTLRPRGRETDAITGVVDLWMMQPHLEGLGVRTETGFLRTTSAVLGVMLNVYNYAADPVPEATRREQAASWQSWLVDQFAG